MEAHQAPPSLGFSRQEHWSGCHFLLQYMKVKRESEVAQSCLTHWPHGLQPTRLLRPWDFPGKSTGVGCHCLLWLVKRTPHKTLETNSELSGAQCNSLLYTCSYYNQWGRKISFTFSHLAENWKSVKTVTAMKWNVLKMLQSVSWKKGEREEGGKGNRDGKKEVENN